jgi:hypothetical protein
MALVLFNIQTTEFGQHINVLTLTNHYYNFSISLQDNFRVWLFTRILAQIIVP